MRSLNWQNIPEGFKNEALKVCGYLKYILDKPLVMQKKLKRLAKRLNH